MIDVAVLAGTVVARFLVPYLEKGAQQLFDAAADKVGQVAADHAKGVTERIWQRVRSVFASDEDKGALANFEKRPQASEKLVEEILREKLEKDEKLARELEELVTSKSPDGSGTGAQIIGTTVGFVDARNAQISGGVVAGLIQGVDPLPGSGPPGRDPNSPSTPPSA
jgi:hypothetical protein